MPGVEKALVVAGCALYLVGEWWYIYRKIKAREAFATESRDTSAVAAHSIRQVTPKEFQDGIDHLRAQITNPVEGLQQLGQPICKKIARESVTMLGGGPAVLLQLAHPYVAYGIKHHSSTKEDPRLRFFKTFDYVFSIMFGDLHTAIKAATEVRSIHSRVNGKIEEAAGAYRMDHAYTAHEEAALMWVYATLIDYAVFTHELMLAPLSYEQKNTYYQFTKRTCVVWGLNAVNLPAEWSDFMDYCNHMWHSPILTVTEPARDMARFLMQQPWWEALYGGRLQERVTAVLLPPPVRTAFGMRVTRPVLYFVCTFLTAVKLIYKTLPVSFRSFTKYMEYERRVSGAKQLPFTSQAGALMGRFVIHIMLTMSEPASKRGAAERSAAVAACGASALSCAAASAAAAAACGPTKAVTGGRGCACATAHAHAAQPPKPAKNLHATTNGTGCPT